MPSDPFYSSAKWRQTRREHLDEHPWCAICAIINLRVLATDVDHVIAKEKVADPYDHENLRSLCKLHHSQKTAKLDHKGRQNAKRFVVHGPDGFPISYREDER
jgi:5-methylcytosine-specific restriction endonuclease McrA